MQRCIELAKNGMGTVNPNPLVGSLIVYNDRVIGEGWHKKAGGDHAEVMAIKSVENKELLKESTLYVNLEPCSHFGRTPPCADLIVSMGIPEVIIGMKDPFAQVNGAGIKKLEDNGVKVSCGLLEAECLELNKRFLCYHEKKRPYIILKWAQSKDGFIAPKGNQEGIYWISSKETKKITHRWRSEEDAILIGRNTLLKDDPELSVRHYDGKNPVRVVLSHSKKGMENTKLFTDEYPALFFYEGESDYETDRKRFIGLKNIEDLNELMLRLHEEQIQSIIIEGGAKIHQSFIDQGLWDEARVISGRKELENGIKAASLDIEERYSVEFHGDKIGYYFQ